ncbi:MAG: hypothetical protein O2944_09740 [Proteobacteria bacterium]|nr:hypothetical protein [Pseudomonadota bacterium]
MSEHHTEDTRKYWLDEKRNVMKLVYGLAVICGLSIVAEFFVHRHIDHPWEVLFGFYGVYGFGACVILVLLAKELRKLIMRKEDYYDE